MIGDGVIYLRFTWAEEYHEHRYFNAHALYIADEKPHTKGILFIEKKKLHSLYFIDTITLVHIYAR